MIGRVKVASMTQQLDACFARTNSIPEDGQLRSDFAKYLCVLVSGYIERAVVALVNEYARSQSTPSVTRYVERNARVSNPKVEKIKQLLGMFSSEWYEDIEIYVIDERKDAVDSIVDLKNSIAHGDSVGVTINRVRDYYAQVKLVIEYIADLCAPLSS